MRAPIGAAVGLTLLGLSLQAQPLPVFLPPSPVLVQYLGLTDNQTLAIRQANNSFQQFVSQKSLRSAQVQREIAAETARPTLDPMALGLRYLELEGIRREIAAEETRTRTTIQAILTDEEKTKVKSLEDAIRLHSVICDAQNTGILARPMSPSINVLGGIISQVPAYVVPLSRIDPFSVCFLTPLPRSVSNFPPSANLTQYLDLTEAQVTAIREANNSYQQFLFRKEARSRQVQQEIAEETAKPGLDAMALGLRYLELEGIRRQEDEEEVRTRAALQALLTPAQQTKLRSLQDADKLQPLGCEAQDARILTLLPTLKWFDTSTSAQAIPAVPVGCAAFSTTVIRNGDFSGIIAPPQP